MNIAKVLKNCPEGTKLYSSLFGEVKFKEINDDFIVVYRRDINGNLTSYFFYKDGKYHFAGECLLFPSKENRDWNKFYKRNNSHLKPFDKVIVCNDNYPWRIDIFERYNSNQKFPYICIFSNVQHCIPADEETIKLIGKTTCWSEDRKESSTENTNLTLYNSEEFNKEKI